MTKLRWTRMPGCAPTKPGEEEMGTAAKPGEDEVKPLSEEELLMMDVKSRQTYCPDSNTIDMGKKRATDQSNNRRAYMPGPRPVMKSHEKSSKVIKSHQKVIKKS